MPPEDCGSLWECGCEGKHKAALARVYPPSGLELFVLIKVENENLTDNMKKKKKKKPSPKVTAGDNNIEILIFNSPRNQLLDTFSRWKLGFITVPNQVSSL